MNRLNELIAKLCPDGVEYRKIKEVCDEVIVPMRDRPKVFDGDIPWCRIEDKEGQYFHGSLSGLGVSEEVIEKMNLKVFPTGTVICSCSASLGAYAINTQPLITNQTFIGLVCGERLFNKYLLYIMETKTAYLKSQASTGTIPYISRKKFEEMIVPVPPLAVQEEVVRILDTYTMITAELQAKLQAELQARKVQYEYYQQKLLDFSDVDTIPLEQLFDTRNGFTPSKSNSDFWTNGTLPWFRMEDIRANGRILNDALQYITHEAAKNKPFPANSIIISTSATIGEHALITCEFLSNQRFTCLMLKPKYKNEYDMKFLFYYCYKLSEYCRRNLNQGNFASVDMTRFYLFEFPIVSIAEQKRIVGILDHFNALYNDITNGIHDEIAARQKQYEYYRDKLLTFKELS